MNIKFEKVSFEQFKKDCEKLGYEGNLEYIYNSIITLPKRGTKGSAGYDFVCPFNLHLEKGETKTFPTGIRVIMPQDVFLSIYPRSGLGFKTGVSLANSVGIIDSDYCFSDNEGHIMIKLVGGFEHLYLEKGQNIVQGIFTNYLTTSDDNTETTRNGGFGSTDINK